MLCLTLMRSWEIWRDSMNKAAIYQVRRVAEDGTSRFVLLSEAEVNCIEVALEQLATLSDAEFGTVNPSQFILNQIMKLNKND